MVNMIRKEIGQLLLFLFQVAVGSLFNQGFQVVCVLLHPSETIIKKKLKIEEERKGGSPNIFAPSFRDN